MGALIDDPMTVQPGWGSAPPSVDRTGAGRKLVSRSWSSGPPPG